MAKQTTIASPGSLGVQSSKTVLNTAVLSSIANVASANVANVANLANALDANINNVHISGGTSGQVLATDGQGNLSWVAQSGGGGNATPGGIEGSIQFNHLGTLSGDATLQYDRTTGIATANGWAGNGSRLSNIAGSNVSGAVALANLATVATTANTVAGANVTGTVPRANVANTVAGANVTGIVANAYSANVAAVALVANSVVAANVVGLTSFVQGTKVTAANTADVALTVAGANVSGQVALAIEVSRPNQPNITSVGTLTTITVGGVSNLGAVGNVKISGGQSGSILTTDGASNLSWASSDAGSF